MIARLNCESGKVCQVVRMCDMPAGECEKKTLGFTCTVTKPMVSVRGTVHWFYEGRVLRCNECGFQFNVLPDANLKQLPGDVQEESACDPVSKREPIKTKHTTSFRATPNAR